ncbi:MAG: DNA-binding protein [Oscillospiraceae bacterium]|nr:DNA-binding protein [Oscillospiraceae bacterium]
MARKREMAQPILDIVPMLKTVEEMSRFSGIGINKLREMINNREIEFVRNGNRFLLADRAIWDWYDRNCVQPETRG